MQPSSAAARGTTIALLAVKALFAVYMTLVLPYLNVIAMSTEVQKEGSPTTGGLERQWEQEWRADVDLHWACRQ